MHGKDDNQKPDFDQINKRIDHECDVARRSLRRFACDVLDASANSGVPTRISLWVLRSDGQNGRYIDPLRTAPDDRDTLPAASAVVSALEPMFQSPGTPAAIAAFGFGGVQQAGEPVKQAAFLAIADVLGRDTQYVRHWTADGPVGPWTESGSGASAIGSYLAAAIKAAHMQPNHLSLPYGTTKSFGAPVTGLEQ